MGAHASPLLRDWQLLQEQVVPPLLKVGRTRTPRVWTAGSAADAVAVTVAYRAGELRGIDGKGGDVPVTPLQVFASDLPAESLPLDFALSDIRCVPAEDRLASFLCQDLRWVPDPAIAEQVVLADPSEPVDLVTIRTNDGSDAISPEQAADQLRAGGHLVVVEPSGGRVAVSGLQPVTTDGRVFRKKARHRRGVRPAAREDRSDTLARRQFQTQLVNTHLRLAGSLARRFAHHGEPTDDLEQVALMALLKASRRYDANRDATFATYATASILGELKRHFRDKTWMMRVPRSVQELYLSVKDAREELGHRLGASPTIPEIAAHLGVPEESVLDAMEAGDSYWPASLDMRMADDEAKTDIPVIDRAFDHSLDVQQLQGLLPRLDRREQLILKRLYFDGRTQRQVAAEIGVSQMQVSRLLVRTITKLRSWAREAERAPVRV